MYPHGFILDVKALSDVMPHEVGYGPDESVGFGAVANKLGPVLIIAQDESELQDWQESEAGLLWEIELNNGNGVVYQWDVVEQLSEVIRREFGVAWGKTLVSFDESIVEKAEMVGLVTHRGMKEICFDQDLILEQVGKVGEGPQSWSEVFDGTTSSIPLGNSVFLHDYHIMDSVDVQMMFKQSLSHSFAVKNLIELLEGLAPLMTVKNMLISTHAKFGARVPGRDKELWLGWEKERWLAFQDKDRNDIKALPIGESCNCQFTLTLTGLIQVKQRLESILFENGWGSINLFMLALNPRNKDSGHARFLVTEYAYAFVDPGWKVFLSERSHKTWKIELSRYSRKLPSTAIGMDQWWHHMNDLAVYVLKAMHGKVCLVWIAMG